MRPLTDLMPHQAPAVQKLLKLRVGAAFMEMGTGKTKVALELACRRWGRINKLVWLCPVSIKDEIAREVTKHVEGVSVYTFSDRTTSATLPSADVYVVGVESISWSPRVISAVNALSGPKTMMVVDESTMIKGHRAQRTKWATLIGKSCRYRLILTGTPITKDVSDLYAQMYFLDEKILGYRSWYSFAANHLEYHPRKKNYVVRAHNIDWLAAKIAPYVYSCTKAECFDLPSKLYGSRWTTMTDEQRHLYEAVKDKMFAQLEAAPEWAESTFVYRLFGALQQVACGFWNEIEGDVTTLHEVEHRRYDALESAINAVPEGERILIWTKYRRCAKEIAERFGAVVHTGDQSPKDRDLVRLAWKSGDARIMVSTPATGGYGLTLTEGAYAIYHSNGMKFSERIQSEDRLHRLGQTRPVTYCDIGVSNTIDERVRDLLSKKSCLADEWTKRVQRIRDKAGRIQALKELVG